MSRERAIEALLASDALRHLVATEYPGETPQGLAETVYATAVSLGRMYPEDVANDPARAVRVAGRILRDPPPADPSEAPPEGVYLPLAETDAHLLWGPALDGSDR